MPCCSSIPMVNLILRGIRCVLCFSCMIRGAKSSHLRCITIPEPQNVDSSILSRARILGTQASQERSCFGYRACTTGGLKYASYLSIQGKKREGVYFYCFILVF